MDLQSLIAKMDAIENNSALKEDTAPSTFTPTHFHKGNLGNIMPLMQTPDGKFWWEGGQQTGEGPIGGSGIVPWQGNTLNRSGWNPASVDGVYKDGKPVEFPEGITWQDYKKQADDDAAILEKLKKLMALFERYKALKAKRGQGAKPTAPTTQNMGDGSQLTVDPKTGNVAATNDDGTPYVPGSNPNLPKNKIAEGIISKELMESFGYQLNEFQLNELPGDVPVPANFGKAPVDSMGNPKPLPGMDRTINPSAFAGAETKVASQAAPAATTGTKVATTGAKTMAKTGSKLLGRAMPGVGAVLGAQGAYDSYKKGDYLGAALNGLAGAFSLVPGLGWVPALGFGAWQAGRELSGATDKYDTPEPQAGGQGPKPSGTPDPKVQELQKRILAKDPKALPQHGADGIMGPETQAAMQRLNIKEGNEMTQPKSLAESMKELQQRLSMIETDTVDPSDGPPMIDADTGINGNTGEGGAEVNTNIEPVAETGVPKAIPPTPEEAQVADMAAKVGGEVAMVGDQIIIITKDKQFVDPNSGELLAKSGDQLAGTGQMFEPSMAEGYEDLEEGFWDSLFKGAAKLGRTGAVMGKRTARLNPGKTALGVGGASLAGGYATGSAGDTTKPPVPPKPVKTNPTGQGATPTDTSADDKELADLKAQIEALMKELSTSKNPEVQKGLATIQAGLK